MEDGCREHGIGAGAQRVQHAAAATICRTRCPALADCAQWLDQLTPRRRPAGVVAGTIPDYAAAVERIRAIPGVTRADPDAVAPGAMRLRAVFDEQAAQWDQPDKVARAQRVAEAVVVSQNWDELRRFMWNYVGIVRTTKRLERAAHRIKMLQEEVADYYGHFRVTPDLIELRNLLQCADLIVKSALHRKESRGLHYTLDYPRLLAEARDTVLVP